MPRGAAPRGGRRLRRGSPTFFEESRGKEHQGQAPGPRFYSRSFPLAGFWDGWLWYGSTAISSGMPKPIWDAFSGKICGKAFYERKSPNQGTKMGSEIPPRPRQCGTNAKTSERQQAGHKTGGPGGLPPALFLPISREKWGPPPGRRGPRGAAPQGGFGGTPPEGTQHRAAPGRWSGFGLAQVGTCEVGSRPVPGGGSRLSLRESPDAKSRGGWPPAPPFFMARSFPLARFGVVGRIVPVYGLLRCPCTCPDLGRFFG